MRPRLRLAVLSLAVTGLVATVPQLGLAGARASAPAGPVTVDQAYPVPAAGKIAITGRGYGHGHGMSQYGAQGAAIEGLGHERILAFYYPGTTLGTTSRKIKVLLT